MLRLLTSIFLLAQLLCAQQEVRFIVFGDSQFGNPAEFERMVYEASLLKPHFAIQVGDMIQGYTHDKEKLRAEWKRYRGQLSLLNSPFYPVPGNHDVVTDEAEEVYAEVWGEDKLYYSFDRGPGHFIVLNSWWGEQDDRIMQWQRNWLKEDLEKYAAAFSGEELKGKSIFVFLHSPLWKYPKDHDGRKDWDMVHEILKPYPVKLVVGGHTHEHVWKHDEGIDYLVINSAGVSSENIRGGKFSAFLHVVIKESDEPGYAAIKAGSIYPLDTVDSLDRVEASKYNIGDKTIRVDEWNEGQLMNRNIEVQIENKLEEKRLYRLDWYIPYQAELTITPESKWIDIPANTTITEIFNITSVNTPSLELMPYLNISSTAEYRSGTLSRDLEMMYRNNKVGIDGYEPALKLEETLSFEGQYNLYLPPSALVKKPEKELLIDGEINENEWINSKALIFSGGGSMNQIETKVYLLYNDDYLYIAARMEEPAPENIHTSAGGEIPLTWNDDDIEFFFDTENNQKDYIRLFQNAAETRFNSLQRRVEDRYFQSRYKSSIKIGDDYWSIEMEIPWSDIDLESPPNSGDTWGFNIGRHRPKGMVTEMRWAGGLYNPRMYGQIIFE